MRTELQKLNGKRLGVSGVVSKFGRKYKSYGRTILISNIIDVDGNLMTDHNWFRLGSNFKSLNLKINDVIFFEADVVQYQKGHFIKDVVDFKLISPTKIVKLNS